jgi:hypothetical protein
VWAKYIVFMLRELVCIVTTVFQTMNFTYRCFTLRLTSCSASSVVTSLGGVRYPVRRRFRARKEAIFRDCRKDCLARSTAQNVGFEVIKCTVFWDITPCSALRVNRRYGATYSFHLQARISREKLTGPPSVHAGSLRNELPLLCPTGSQPIATEALCSISFLLAPQSQFAADVEPNSRVSWGHPRRQNGI